MRVKVAEGRSVAVDGEVYLGGQEFTVPEEHRDEADTWVLLGYVAEVKARKPRRRGGAKAEAATVEAPEER